VEREGSAVSQRRTAARRRSIEARANANANADANVIAPAPIDSVELLVARARRLWTQGEIRRSLSLLREACNEDEWRARTWTILAARLAEAGLRDEAAQAFTRARWLRKRAGDGARAAVTERLAARAAA
jgi:Tfp pilus assembly protein PilF